MNWTPPKLVNWISKDLEDKGFPQPHRFQAEQLVSHALGISRLDIYLQHDKPCTSDEQKKLRELVKRRYKSEPIAYILGNCDFWSLNLDVGPGVLIPRPDTEILVETTLKWLPKFSGQSVLKVLELGTGTAAIPLSICVERDHIDIVATEYSSSALRFAKRNILNHDSLLKNKNNCIQLVQTDKFAGIKPTASFDVIVSNPPYIPQDHIQTLQKEVSQWEPVLALSGGQSGIEFYEYLTLSAALYLKPSGCLIMEHGFDQAVTIKSLMNGDSRLKLIEEHKDYSGHDRVMVFQKID